MRMRSELLALESVQRRRPARRGRDERCRDQDHGDGPEAVQGREDSGVTDVYVGIGSNLGDRAGYVRRALERLASEPGIDLEAISEIRETDPVGVVDQPKFLNAAAHVTTELPPRALLERLLEIERDLGRVRTDERFGPRTIDLDLLLYGDRVVDEPGLRVPHPRLAERRFALEPLVELNPALVVPGRGSVRALLASLE
jgi:2-amino-4-hydroxy-6-hydroxymethyldihydropteridine diphosphokinase